MSAAANAYGASISWHEIADQTLHVMRALLSPGNGAAPEPGPRSLPARQ